MLFASTTFIGIDPTAGQKPFAYAALDSDRRLLALGQGSLDEMLAFAAGQRQAFVAVCAPRRPNQGLMTQDTVRQNLNPPPHPGRWVNFRLAEYLLRQHNIIVPQTYANPEDCPRWMQMGFTLFRRLDGFGYQPYPHEDCPRQSLEVYPHAAFTALLGVTPFPKHSLEGRLQRQLILHDLKLPVPDPMDFFEEITRHRLLKGVLPAGDLHTPFELDALVAAYTAWLCASQPQDVSLLGDPAEGQIALPVAQLQPRY
jgi:hypothetical protein